MKFNIKIFRDGVVHLLQALLLLVVFVDSTNIFFLLKMIFYSLQTFPVFLRWKEDLIFLKVKRRCTSCWLKRGIASFKK